MAAKKKKLPKKPAVKKAAKPAPKKKAAPAKAAPKKLAAKPAAKGKAPVKAKPAAKVGKAAVGKAAVTGKAAKPAAAPAAKAKGSDKIAKGKAAPQEAELLKGKKGKAPVIEVVEEVVEPEEVVLTDAEGRRYCRVKDCDQLAVVDTYCRYHYLLFWKKIQIRKKILTEGKLERYIEDLTARYPDKFLDMLRKDLRSEKEFLAAIAELEIDESAVENEFEDEAQNYLDEVRGMGTEAATESEDF